MVMGEVDVVGIYYGEAPTSQDAWGKAWSATWGRGWDACQKAYPATRSIELRSYSFSATLKDT